MEFITTNSPIEEASQLIASEISSRLLDQQSVLWLVSGGSGAKVALRVAELLGDQPLERLSVTMSDERFGQIGHNDENWQQLLNAGFKLEAADLYRPLIGANRQITAEAFENWIKSKLTSCNYTIGIFGIGTDGHTAGIKPDSIAAQSDKLVADFKGNDYERITITFPAIRALDKIVVQATGDDKLPALKRLEQPNYDLSEFPVAIFQQRSNVSLYSDQPNIKPLDMLG